MCAWRAFARKVAAKATLLLAAAIVRVKLRVQ
jgi:hypothetical protein